MRKLLFALTILSILVLTGCACMREPAYTAPKPAPAPAPAPAKPAPAPAKPAAAMNTASQVYMAPCCGALRLDKQLPETVTLDQPFEYTITATNLTDQMLRNVVIREQLPEGLEYVSSTPPARADEDRLVWRLSQMNPSAQQVIKVRVRATSDGTLATCADATYILPACAKTQVVNPALALVKSAPAQVMICEAIPFKFTVTNSGTGTAANVVIRDELPEGLTTVDGQRIISIPVGPLQAGQSATQTVMVKAARTGAYENQAFATADGDLRAESETVAIRVTQPVLKIEKTASREEQYVGRRIEYTIKVTNSGDAVAQNTVITDTIPAGAQEVRISQPGQLAGSQAVWNLGDLAPKASRSVTISYLPATIGQLTNTAKAEAACAQAVTASSRVKISGIPGLLLEVIDVHDPIEVGQNETYTIVVTNQGSAVANNIRITNRLEDTMQFVSAGGATPGRFEGGSVVFQPLPSLAPKAQATWTVVVKAVAPGDVRFMTTMTADELDREVGETESTHFYE